MWYGAFTSAESIPLTGGASSAFAGKASLEGFAAGSMLMGFGISRISGANNTNIKDEVMGVFSPIITSIAPAMKKEQQK